MSVQECRLAFDRLDAEMANELGAGYATSQRYGEIFAGFGPPLTDRERALVALHREIVARATAVLAAIDNRSQSPVSVAEL